jgi:hypothetical protein
MFFAAIATASAADMCTGQGQILVPGGPNGVCIQGYYGANVSNCNAVPNALFVVTADGGLTCVAGPTCPAGYAGGLPPVVGAPSNQSISSNACQAVCSPVFVSHGWPCSCPYGQHVNTQSQQCVPNCGPSATWQHSPDYWSKHPYASATELSPDPGVCTCPSGQEYVTGQSACMALCPQGQSRDDTGQCMAPYNGGAEKFCLNGQTISACTCPPGGVVVGGKCYICSTKTPSGACQPNPSPPSDANDGYQPPTLGGIGQPQSCIAGKHWNGLKCVNDQPGCGAGTHWNGSACVANLPAMGLCEAGTHWNGTRCVLNAGVVLPMHLCRAGWHWDGRICVANDCPVRQHWDGRTCVAN